MSTFGTIPQTLADRLKSGMVVPFVGAGVSMAVHSKKSGDQLFPSWKALIEAGIKQLQNDGKGETASHAQVLLSDNDYLGAAHWIEEGLRGQLAKLIKQQVGVSREHIQEESLELARLIWQLGSPLVITTNYDRVLEWACPQIGDCNRIVNRQAFELAGILSGQQSATVWHLHGYIGDMDSLVLTPSGYDRLYPQEGGKAEWQAALETFRHTIATKSLLFIGYGLGDVQIIEQLQEVGILFNGAPGPHYVLGTEQVRLRIAAKKLPIEVVTYERHGEPLLELLRALKPEEEVIAAVSAASAISPIDSATVAADFDPRYPSFNVPYRQKGAQVLGRAEQLKQVRTQLTEGVATSIGQVASFDGIGGLGKTQLAVEYAYRFRNDYPQGVVWLNADGDIESQLTEVAQASQWVSPLSDHKFKLDLALRRVKTYSDCLLIFDNVEDLKDIEPYLPEHQANPHILITCRTPQTGFTSIPLDILEREVSLQLLVQEANRKPTEEAENATALQIVEALGDLPLAIELAGAFIQRFQMKWQDYLDLLQEDLSSALPPGFSSFTRHEVDLYRTLHISDRVFADAPLLKEVLDVLTWSGTAPMGTELLASIIDVQPLQLVTALSEGVALRLLQRTSDLESHALHRLVQQVRRSEIPLEERVAWVERTSHRIGNWFESRKYDFSALPEFERELAHLAAWQGHTSRLVPREGIRLLWLQAYPHSHRGHYHNVRPIIEEAIKAHRSTIADDKELEAHLLSDMGSVEGTLGNYQGALKLFEQALSIRRQLLGDHHIDTATSLNNVGTAYAELNQPIKAFEFIEQGLSIERELQGERHPQTLSVLSNLGGIHLRFNQPQRALELFEQALTTRRGVLGERHPDIADSLSSIGVAYCDLNQPKKGFDFLEQALIIRREVLGEHHPATASSRSNLASAYHDLNQSDHAIELLQQALLTQREILGERHPDTLTSLHNLGTIYSDLDQPQRALEILEPAFALRCEVLGERHPDTATSLRILGTTYGQLGYDQKELEMLEQAISISRETWGVSHPDTLKTIYKLIHALEKARDFRRGFQLIDAMLMGLPRQHPKFDEFEDRAILLLRVSRKSRVGIAQIVKQYKRKWRHSPRP